MITESLGRTTIYLGTLSATLVAFALIVQGEIRSTTTSSSHSCSCPHLIFLGTVTFVRVLENSIEDTIYVMAINRIRHYYMEHAGEDSRYFTLSAAMTPGRCIREHRARRIEMASVLQRRSRSRADQQHGRGCSCRRRPRCAGVPRGGVGRGRAGDRSGFWSALQGGMVPAEERSKAALRSSQRMQTRLRGGKEPFGRITCAN